MGLSIKLAPKQERAVEQYSRLMAVSHDQLEQAEDRLEQAQAALDVAGTVLDAAQRPRRPLIVHT